MDALRKSKFDSSVYDQMAFPLFQLLVKNWGIVGGIDFPVFGGKTLGCCIYFKSLNLDYDQWWNNLERSMQHDDSGLGSKGKSSFLFSGKSATSSE